MTDYYAVTNVHLWEDVTFCGHKLVNPFNDEHFIGFIPVYDDRSAAAHAAAPSSQVLVVQAKEEDPQ